jgi:F-type H+-transporting ATPase subunit alpha
VAAAQRLELARSLKPRGVVRRVGDGVARLAGLPDVGFEELLQFESGALGMAYDLGEQSVGAILLSHAGRVRAGEGVRGERRLPEISVGPATLGRVIDPLGNPLDDGPPLPLRPASPLFRPAPEIIERKSVDQTLWTGILAIDAAIPIGRGQRELIAGDRNVGKTALAIDIVANQRRGDVACVYVVIGQPMSRVLSLRETLEAAGCLSNTAIVAADASSSPGMQYLAPYAGASVAESFRDEGRHALVVYDDLTKHADAYRELALLLDRPPGREAFPGDIFYIHAELLERATARRAEHGDGSVTAFPLIETIDGDISSYIPTNLISITDGQIYLDAGRFQRNLRPAIDIGNSVSRVGGVAQQPAMRQVARNLRIRMSQFESLESLARVGFEMDVGMRETIRHGELLRELLRQPRLAKRSPLEQVAALWAVAAGLLDRLPPERLGPACLALADEARRRWPELDRHIASGGSLPPDWSDTMTAFAEHRALEFVAPPSSATPQTAAAPPASQTAATAAPRPEKS